MNKLKDAWDQVRLGSAWTDDRLRMDNAVTRYEALLAAAEAYINREPNAVNTLKDAIAEAKK